ncbi:MAG: Rossmann-fold NAD(P)-binding domain-containing protein [Thiobacillus sp.]
MTSNPLPDPPPLAGEGATGALRAPKPIDEVVVIGLGQLGRVFAGGLLRSGHTVVPVNRGDDLFTVAHAHPEPALVLVAVAENDLHTVLAAMPGAWRTHVALIQNELLPRDWEKYRYTDPTVISVWFEKKKGTDARPLIASPAAGPGAALLCRALASIELPCREVAPGDELLFELVRKNVYILTTNIAGLQTGGTVSQLWAQHEAFARRVANEVMDIQDALTGVKHDRDRLVAGMLEAFEGDPEHGCTGRSAPARLARALQQADAFGLAVPTLRALAG